MKNILHKGLVFLSLIFSGALLVSHFAAYINPNTLSFPAFFGLAFPYLLIINASFILYWLLRQRWTFLLPLFVILISYGNVSKFYQLSEGDEVVVSDSVQLNVLSYNVRLFDRYKWTKDPNTPQNIINLINSQEPDVVCLQEYRSTTEGFLSLSNLKKELGMSHVYYNNIKGGVIIFSKHPIVNQAQILFENDHLCKAIFIDISIKGKLLRVYNLHLESNRFVGKNYDFIKKDDYEGNREEFDEVKDISLRLIYAFQRRAEQALKIRQHIDQSPNPVLICGDFNDTPNSYAYRQLSKGFKDAFVEQGKGISTTYLGDFPSFRIDYLLYPKDMTCIRYNRIKKKYSDHYPICATFTFNEN